MGLPCETCGKMATFTCPNCTESLYCTENCRLRARFTHSLLCIEGNILSPYEEYVDVNRPSLNHFRCLFFPEYSDPNVVSKPTWQWLEFDFPEGHGEEEAHKATPKIDSVIRTERYPDKGYREWKKVGHPIHGIGLDHCLNIHYFEDEKLGRNRSAERCIRGEKGRKPGHFHGPLLVWARAWGYTDGFGAPKDMGIRDFGTVVDWINSFHEKHTSEWDIIEAEWKEFKV